jgi:hypothetical protein
LTVLTRPEAGGDQPVQQAGAVTAVFRRLVDAELQFVQVPDLAEVPEDPREAPPAPARRSPAVVRGSRTVEGHERREQTDRPHPGGHIPRQQRPQVVGLAAAVFVVVGVEPLAAVRSSVV